jgi:hypothetical protein
MVIHAGGADKFTMARKRIDVEGKAKRCDARGLNASNETENIDGRNPRIGTG